MLDIRYVYENKDAVIKSLGRRNKDFSVEINKVVELYTTYRANLVILEDAKSIINTNSKMIGQYKKENKDVTELLETINSAKEEIKDLEADSLLKEATNILMGIPNMLLDIVPDGTDEDQNVEVKKVMQPREFDFEIKPHYEIGENIGGLDFASAANISKNRFVITKGFLARLERALTNFMLDSHNDKGYVEVGVPVVVNQNTLLGSGNLPKFQDDLFKIARPETDEDEFMENERDFYLIPTAEVVLANLHQNEIINKDNLPFSYTAYSQCFRKEAGSAGKDTRGMIRVHQFGKVELFKYATPETSNQELLNMVSDAEYILQELKLPYRVLALCAGDIGFSSQQTFDLEVWFPSQEKYRECSSCSNTGDFQARRTKVRYKNDEGQVVLPHLLNGSGMATGRILAAIIENYQNEDGTVSVPDVLKGYMNVK